LAGLTLEDKHSYLETALIDYCSFKDFELLLELQPDIAQTFTLFRLCF